MKLVFPDLEDSDELYPFLILTSPIYLGWAIWWIKQGFSKDKKQVDIHPVNSSVQDGVNHTNKDNSSKSNSNDNNLLKNHHKQEYPAKEKCKQCGAEYSSSDYDQSADIWRCTECKGEIPKIELSPEDIPRKEKEMKPGAKIAIRVSLYFIWPIIWLFLYVFYEAIKKDLIRPGILSFLQNTLGIENIVTVSQIWGVIGAMFFVFLIFILVKGFLIITKETK